MDYKALKDLIKESVAELERDETSRLSFSPRTTSLTVQRADRGSRNSEENFFERLEREVSDMSAPTRHGYLHCPHHVLKCTRSLC